MKNLNKNDPFFLFYTVSHFIGLNTKHVTTHPVSDNPRGLKIPTWGETEGWGLYKQVSSLGGIFYEGNKSFLCATRGPINLSPVDE